MTGNHPEWFTPGMQYLSMKEEFLGSFLNDSTWGEFGTREEVIALSSLLEYFERTKQLADQFPQLLSDVIVDNKNLIIQRMVPLPDKLYEQVLLAVVEGAQQQYKSIWGQPSNVTLDKIEKFLSRRKTGSLLVLESKMWSEVDSSKNCTFDNKSDEAEDALEDTKNGRDIAKAAADLRKLRNEIYSGIRYRQNVQARLRKFHSHTEGFLGRFGSQLSVNEAETFRNRVRIASRSEIHHPILLSLKTRIKA